MLLKAKPSADPSLPGVVELTAALKRLHEAGMPLNITAAKRHYPQLLAAAFAQQPFLGWRRALRQAGIDYSKIRVELPSLLTCAICDKEVGNLANHVRLKHQVAWDEYLLDHPDAEVLPEWERRRRSFREWTKLAHWEPLWTPEYVLDRLSAWHESGAAMNHVAMEEQDTPLMNSVRRWWPKHTYDELLTKIGLDAEDIRLRDDFTTITPEMVVQKIQQRHAEGLPVNAGELVRGTHADIQTYTLGLRLFGSWLEALHAAGIDPEASGAFVPRFASRQAVLDEILRRQAAGLTILHGPVTRSDTALASGAYRHFGSWNLALQALNLTAEAETVEGSSLKRRAGPHCR
ncbi:MAG TPA: hypothetical protein DDZ88_27600 [Verrucomicrobiales bacterium]|nr:hypothetical protein [Verrucomicrobiales bacterium]